MFPIPLRGILRSFHHTSITLRLLWAVLTVASFPGALAVDKRLVRRERRGDIQANVQVGVMGSSQVQLRPPRRGLVQGLETECRGVVGIPLVENEKYNSIA